MSSNRFSHRILIVSILILNQAAIAADEPDLRREKRLHQIYKQYNLSPTDEESWRGVLTGKTQTYGIQEGDTLWDLSETLFDDPGFWPKVWSLNAEKIENPHQIVPGLSVLFTPGSTGDAPSLDVKPTKDLPGEENVVEVPIAAPENKDLLKKAEIPEEDLSVPPVAVPPSLPHWIHGQALRAPLKFEVQKINQNFGTPDEPLQFYLAHQSSEDVGTVAETEMGTLTAGDFQYVTVRLSQGQAGKSLLVIKEMGKVKDPFNDSNGYLVQIQGELEVLEPVNREENLYRALVKKALHPIEVGAKLLMSEMPMFNAQDTSTGQASARVIGGQDATDRRILGTQNLIFLSGQGLSPGQSYPIYRYQKSRIQNSKHIENPQQIAKVKVVRVSNGLATALVLQSSEEIQVGDMTDPRALTK